MTSTLPPIVQAVSGAVGSAFANALTYPLDLATTRQQLHRKRKGTSGLYDGIRILVHIIRRYGLTALYDGIMTDTSASLVSNFCYYYIYTFLRNSVLRYRYNDTKAKISLPMLQELFLGFIAGVASRAVSMPLNLITLRLQAERDADDDDDDGDTDEAQDVGLSSVIKFIYSEHGLFGFWRGFHTTILLSLNPSITLAVFQFYRRVVARLSRSRSSTIKPNPKEAFIGGAVSSSIAVAILYPLILAKLRLQAQRKTTSASSAATLGSILLDALKSPGGLYQGLEMQISKGFLGQGVSFLVKERIEQFVIQSYLSRRRSHGKPDAA
ncbi:mitochondrial carrier domain-containing protein [Desarmillaria tabescens]|uniref:Mitochondrial carrier domain-containing protein n=1 Tax=Armillaria tabescens TaxID=1929756 RepID=A0AA39N617_ARMTA|nr:mitochondrial carrier domain-containing protein [Desarmillaria tabescens]KAK0459212.1 mitochondrial carrier domain-containing protein [Desarmillaria tabescens]